jgi:hypothetical protein
MHLGSAYLYLATESNVPEFRRHVIASVERFAVLAPKIASELVRAGLAAYLARRRTATPKNQGASAEDDKPAVNKQPRLLAFLSASATFGEGTEPTLREQLLSESIVLAHHPAICEYLWVGTLPRSNEVIVVSQVEILGKFGLTYARRRV